MVRHVLDVRVCDVVFWLLGQFPEGVGVPKMETVKRPVRWNSGGYTLQVRDVSDICQPVVRVHPGDHIVDLRRAECELAVAVVTHTTSIVWNKTISNFTVRGKNNFHLSFRDVHVILSCGCVEDIVLTCVRGCGEDVLLTCDCGEDVFPCACVCGEDSVFTGDCVCGCGEEAVMRCCGVCRCQEVVGAEGRVESLRCRRVHGEDVRRLCWSSDLHNPKNGHEMQPCMSTLN